MPSMTKPERIQLWLDRLNRHAASQLTFAEFCQREEVSLPSFHQWKRRLSPRVESATRRRKSRQPRPSPGNPAISGRQGFTELVIKASQQPPVFHFPVTSRFRWEPNPRSLA